jgi:hypothetical protein
MHVRHGQLLGSGSSKYPVSAQTGVLSSAAIIYATTTTDLAALVMGGWTSGWRP